MHPSHHLARLRGWVGDPLGTIHGTPQHPAIQATPVRLQPAQSPAPPPRGHPFRLMSDRNAPPTANRDRPPVPSIDPEACCTPFVMKWTPASIPNPCRWTRSLDGWLASGVRRSPQSNRTRVGATYPAPSRGPRLGLRGRAWVRQEATFGLARIHHPTWHPAWSRLPLPLPKQAHKTTGFAWRKWKAKGAAKMGAFDERAKTLDLREKLATFAPLEVRGCGEIGRHARLRIWCFGVGVRVPPPAPLQEKRQVNPCP